jgi:hypothetical protein
VGGRCCARALTVRSRPLVDGFVPDPRRLTFERAGSSAQTRLVWKQQPAHGFASEV